VRCRYIGITGAAIAAIIAAMTLSEAYTSLISIFTKATNVVIFILAFVILLYLIICGRPVKHSIEQNRAPINIAGGGAAAPQNIIVDTLNLTHWLFPDSILSEDLIIKSIDQTASKLKKQYPGKVIYVLKDRETTFNDKFTHVALKETADRNLVTIIVAEKYKDPPSSEADKSVSHSSRGRDDFLMSVLARQWRCPVLTEDRLRDFDEFRSNIKPFHTYEFTYYKQLPTREFYRPDAPSYIRLKKPRMRRYSDHF